MTEQRNPTAPFAGKSNRCDLNEGLVITHLGKGLAVETTAGDVVLCHTRRRLETAAVGDRVLWESLDDTHGRVMEILTRKSVLTRPCGSQRIRPVAANLDQILIVFASLPRCDFLLIDQYLVLCEIRSINPLLICNKDDLPPADHPMEKELDCYRGLGYPVFSVSAKAGTGLNDLQKNLAGQLSILAGQSGVGKSSLTNALLPNKNLRTQTLSRGTGHGKHTTTAATLFHLPCGGDLIDSPGVSIFGLADVTETELAQGYREFHQHLGHCLFNDCRHLNDKGCAVTNAVANADISLERYRRFLKLREKLPGTPNRQ